MNEIKTKPTLWEPVVIEALRNLGGEAPLANLYAEVKKLCERPGSTRPITTFYKDKVRQVVQRSAACERVASGVWKLKDEVR